MQMLSHLSGQPSQGLSQLGIAMDMLELVLYCLLYLYELAIDECIILQAGVVLPPSKLTDI